MAACPDADALQGFVSGAVGDVERSMIEQHVDTCASCRRMLVALAPSVVSPQGEAVADTPRLSGAALVKRIERYTIRSKLGEGGMGIVYQAHDPELHRDIAIKLLRPSPSPEYDTGGAQARLLREAQAMARVSHPNVIAVYEAGTWEGQVFIAMELATAGTLRRWQTEPNRTARELLDAYLSAGRGLAAAHAAGLVHRDFKPDNVLRGADGRVRVTDFGLARAEGAASAAAASGMIGASLTETGAVMGTPAYMAPEQGMAKPVDGRTDLFSLGCVLYRLCAGKLPFDRPSVMAILTAIATEEPTPPALRARSAAAGPGAEGRRCAAPSAPRRGATAGRAPGRRRPCRRGPAHASAQSVPVVSPPRRWILPKWPPG